MTSRAVEIEKLKVVKRMNSMKSFPIIFRIGKFIKRTQ